jgi:hypothetical protein
MKRIYAIAMAICLLMAARVPIQLYAADGLAFSLSYIGNVSRGETITIPINVSNNPGFSGVGLEMIYDPNVLEIRVVAAPVAAMPLNSQFALTSSPGIQWISLVNTIPENWHGNGIAANVTFYVKPTAAFGTSVINLKFTHSPDGTPINADEIKITDAVTISASINVVDNFRPNTYPDNQQDPYQPVERPVSRTTNPSDNENEINNNFEPYEYHPPPNDNIDYGSFIGTQHVPAANDSVYEPNSPQTNNTDNTNRTSDFGVVPQTNVLDITGWIITLCVSIFALSALLCVYVFRQKQLKERNVKT